MSGPTPSRRARRIARDGRVPDPVTSHEPYDDDEAEFLRAVTAWQARTGTRFPRATDYLMILKSLGYRRPGQDDAT